MSKDDGGNAFPVADYDHQVFQPATGDEVKRQLSGMSLRDYFAAKAAQGLISGSMADGSTWEKGSDQVIALAAYGVADAMLAARAK